MIFYLFQCSSDKSLYGATDDSTGAKLARSACAGGTWVTQKTLEGSAIGFSATKAEISIKLNGYYLFRVEVQVGRP